MASETAFSSIHPDLTSRLGQIVVNTAVIEQWVGHLLANMLDADPGALHVITNEMSSAAVIQHVRTFISLFEDKNPELSLIKGLMDDADAIRTERNELVHGLWDATNCEPGSALIQITKWRAAEITRERLITTVELDELLTDCKEWLDAFVYLGRQFNFPRAKGSTSSIFAD
jgi:hypothetical protein